MHVNIDKFQVTDFPKAQFTVELLEEDGKHFYVVNGEGTKFPGSTTVLNAAAKPFLVPWAAKVCMGYVQKVLSKAVALFFRSEKKFILTAASEFRFQRFVNKLCLRGKKQHKFIKEDAGDLGTRAHKAIDALINGGYAELTDDIKPVVEGYYEWLAKTNLTIIKGDTKLAHPEIGYGGSLDALALDENGRFVIIDFKTSNQISDTYAYQVASYAAAFQRMFGIDYLPDGYILRFDKKKPKVEVRKIASTEKSFKGFVHCLGLYHDLQREQFSERTIIEAEKETAHVRPVTKRLHRQQREVSQA